jgi:hypothetical protein
MRGVYDYVKCLWANKFGGLSLIVFMIGEFQLLVRSSMDMESALLFAVTLVAGSMAGWTQFCIYTEEDRAIRAGARGVLFT